MEIDERQVAVLGALDAAVTHGGHLCAGFIQSPGPGEHKGVNSAGAEGNWDVGVAVLQFKRAPQPGRVNTLPTHKVDRYPHSARLTSQGRQVEFIGQRHLLGSRCAATCRTRRY